MKDCKFPTVEELLEAGVHFGHSVNKWNPKMEPYIYAAKQGVHILDLDQTEKLLKEAGEFLYDIAAQGGQIIFVCTKKQVAKISKERATRCGALFMSERWMGGTITNYKIIKKSIDKLVSLKKKREAGDLGMYTKKERLLIDRDIEKLERFFGGVVGLKGEPQAVLVVDAKREKTAINESRIFNVPVVALIDTNSDPTGVTKIIPGNDDAAKSVGKVLSVLADCIEAGYKEFEKKKAEAAEKKNAEKAAEAKPMTKAAATEGAVEVKKPEEVKSEEVKKEAPAKKSPAKKTAASGKKKESK